MDEMKFAKLEAEGQLYRKVHSKISNLIAAHERLLSGEVDQIAIDFSMTQEQIDAYKLKLENEKGLIIQELLGIYQTYLESQNAQ